MLLLRRLKTLSKNPDNVKEATEVTFDKDDIFEPIPDYVLIRKPVSINVGKYFSGFSYCR